MRSRLVGLIVAMVLFWCGSAMAYDPAGCDLFDGHFWGDNVTCLGFVEPHEMGQFENGDWEWKEPFASMETATPMYVGFLNTWVPDGGLTEMKPVSVGTQIMNFQIDNRRKANGNWDSRAKFNGLKNAAQVPMIVAFEVRQPGADCTPDDDFHFNDVNFCDADIHCGDDGNIVEGAPCFQLANISENYPVIMYQFMPVFDQDIFEQCMAGGGADWECNDQANTGIQFRLAGEPLVPSDVAGVAWEEGDETSMECAFESETYFYQKYNMGPNIVDGGGPRTAALPMMYFAPFSTGAEFGDNHYRITLTEGKFFDETVYIASDTLMPTVASKTYYTDIVATKTNKSGKIIKATETQVAVDNLTAREITADDGSARLLVQWAEPDRAMELVSSGNVRLRIYVGDGWFNTMRNNDVPVDVHFLWLDVPVHAGSVVVPADSYGWIKQFAPANGGALDVAGMYREQFDSYHNRGYIDGIQFQVPK